MPSRVEPARRDRYLELRQTGYTKTDAARQAGVSKGWACSFEQRLRTTNATCPICGHRPGLTRE